MPSYKTGNLSGFTINEKDWDTSSGGKTCKAIRKRDGVQVFIKQYGGLKEPIHDASTSNALFAKKLEKFERLVRVRSEVNKRMRSMSGPGGNIIIPYDEFVCDHLYTEVSEFVQGLMGPSEILALSEQEKLKFVMTAVNALSAVHDNKVIHIDIKPPNVIAVRNERGMVVAKIIDFDSSLQTDLPVPSETGGDQVYQSPELAYYNSSEGDPDAAKLISTKTDIYSMGLTMHYYLTGGKLPGYTGVTEPGMKEYINKKEANHKTVYLWEALLGDGTLVMDPSLPKPIAEIIAKMTVAEPDKRPTGRDVFSMLSDIMSSGGKEAPADSFDPPRDADQITWVLPKLEADNYTGIHYSRIMRSYELTRNRAVIKRMNVTKLKEAGYAVAVEVSDTFDPPAPADGIEWDIKRLQAMGYTGIHPEGAGKYRLTKNGRTMEKDCDVENLIRRKFARRTGKISPVPEPPTPPKPEPPKPEPPKPEPPKPDPGLDGFDEQPDPKDGIQSWNTEKLQHLGYTGIRSLGGGKYALVSKGKVMGVYEAKRLIQLKYAIPGSKKEEDVFDAPDSADGISAWDEGKLRSRGYTGIHPAGDGKYTLIMNGRSQGEYTKEKLIRLGYAIPAE